MNNLSGVNYRKMEQIENVCALAFLVLLLLKFGFYNTRAALPAEYGTLLSVNICIPIIISLAVRRYSKLELFGTIALLLIGAVSYLVSRDMTMFLALCAIVVLRGQSPEQLLKWHVAIRAILLAVLYTLVAVGTVENLEFSINKSGYYSIIAYSFGHAHPNQLALAFATFVFAFLCIIDKKEYNFKLAVLAVATAFVYAVTRCRTMIVAVVLALICAFILQNKVCSKIVNGLLKWLYIPIILLFLFIGIGGPYLMDSDNEALSRIITAISDFGNGRISNATFIADAVPVSLFGSSVDFNEITHLPIDCSYTVMLYRFGVVSTAACMAIYAFACHRYLKQEKPMYAICILITLLYALFEDLLFWPMMNVSLFLSAAAFMRPAEEKRTIGFIRMSSAEKTQPRREPQQSMEPQQMRREPQQSMEPQQMRKESQQRREPQQRMEPPYRNYRD